MFPRPGVAFRLAQPAPYGGVWFFFFFWLDWVFTAARAFELQQAGSRAGAQQLWHTGLLALRHVIFPDQESNMCPQPWQVDSLPEPPGKPQMVGFDGDGRAPAQCRARTVPGRHPR